MSEGKAGYEKATFYVAHPKMTQEVLSGEPKWMKPTLEEAIEHAKEVLSKSDHEEAALIVGVVAIIWKRRGGKFKVDCL